MICDPCQAGDHELCSVDGCMCIDMDHDDDVTRPQED